MRFLLLGIFLPSLCFGLSLNQQPAVPQPSVSFKAPEPRVFRVVDRENGLIYYETTPIEFTDAGLGSSTNGALVLRPVISVAARTGDTQFHLWVSYHPPLSPLGGTTFINPKYFSVQTLYNKVKLPLLYRRTESALTQGVRVGSLAIGSVSPLRETAYALLTPSDMFNLSLIASEGFENTAPEPWEPMAVERANQYMALVTQGFLDIQQMENGVNMQYGEAYNPQQRYPSIARRQEVSLVLHGENEEKNIVTAQENLIPIMEMMVLYQALSNRRIP